MTQPPLPIVDEVVWELEAAKRAHIEAFDGDSSGLVSDEERSKANTRLWAAVEATLEAAALVSPPTQAGGDPVPVAWRAKSYSRNEWAYGETAAIACERACHNSEEVIEKLEPLYAAPIASKEACGDGVREALVEAPEIANEIWEILFSATKDDVPEALTNELLLTVAEGLIAGYAIRALTPNPGAAE